MSPECEGQARKDLVGQAVSGSQGIILKVVSNMEGIPAGELFSQITWALIAV